MVELVKDGKLEISEPDWKKLNENFTKEEIIQLLSNCIADNNLSLPYNEITIEEALADFEALKKLDTSTLLKGGTVFTKYPYKYAMSGMYIDASNIGNKSSNYFHQKNRFLCDSINAPSPYRTWTIEKFRKNVLKGLWTLKVKEVNSKTLRSLLSLRNYTASQFKPSAAKAIYDYLGSKYVLDFSSGWGDRFAGFCAAKETKHYEGIDPNINLHEGYWQQVAAYNPCGLAENKKDGVAFIHSPAEEMRYENLWFDTVFTSPPYFNAERYTQEENQSWKRYKKLDSWLENFLFKTLRRTWDGLQTNGFVAINIADVYTGHKVNKICDPMNDFISTLPNAKYLGALGMRMAKRPQSASDKQGIYVEPIWLWEKSST